MTTVWSTLQDAKSACEARQDYMMAAVLSLAIAEIERTKPDHIRILANTLSYLKHNKSIDAATLYVEYALEQCRAEDRSLMVML